MTPKFELGRNLCTMHLTAKFHHPTFKLNRSEVTTLTNKQTDAADNIHFAPLCHMPVGNKLHHSDVISSYYIYIYASFFFRHDAGQTLRNACYCDITVSVRQWQYEHFTGVDCG